MDGITNSVWGPVYWKMFHYITLSYPINPTQMHIDKIKNFFCDIVPIILPCFKCRKHYQQNLELNPLTDEILEIKFKLVIWLLDMHNYVNKQLDKNEISYEDALVELFIPEYLKEKNDENNSHYEIKKDLYAEDKLKKLLDNLVYIQSAQNYIYNINSIINQKENELQFRKEIEKKRKENEIENQNNLTNINQNNKDEKELEKVKEHHQNYFNNLVKGMKLEKYKIDEQNTSISEIKIKKQEYIDMNLIIKKILYYIDKCNDNKEKYLIYTGFESICFIFN